MDKMYNATTTSIEQEIIVLLNKKYNINNYYYDDTRSYYLNNINREILETQLNYTNNDFRYSYSNGISIDNTNKVNEIDSLGKIIDNYLEIDGYICYYDIDILNLIIKFILLNRKMPENIYDKDNKSIHNRSIPTSISTSTSYSYLDLVYNYFYNNNQPLPLSQSNKTHEYSKDITYFKKTYNNLGIEKKVLEKFYFIVEEIIIPFSTYILL